MSDYVRNSLIMGAVWGGLFGFFFAGVLGGIALGTLGAFIGYVGANSTEQKRKLRRHGDPT